MGCKGLCGPHYMENLKAKALLTKAKEKKAKMRQKRADSFSKLRDTLDQVFSKFIRLRDTDCDGVGFCIDCGERMEWHELDNGHFIGRDRLITRWDEQNCAAQKSSCNRFHSGRQFEFGLALDQRYGPDTAKDILQRSYTIVKYPTIELKEMIAHYEKKVQELLQKKNFRPWKK